MSGVSDAVWQQRRGGGAFPRAPASSNHCRSSLGFFYVPKNWKWPQKTLIFLISFSSRPAKTVLLPCFSPMSAVQHLINAFIEVPNHTHVPSAAPPSSSRSFRHTWARPVCTFHDALDTGASPQCVSSVKRPKSAHCWWIRGSEFYCLSLSILRCYSCLVVFGGLNSVKSHIQQAHCDVFQKCPSCPMAFKSAPSIQSHIASQHPALTDKQTTYVFTPGLRCNSTDVGGNWFISFFIFSGWFLNVSCVTQFLQTRLS